MFEIQSTGNRLHVHAVILIFCRKVMSHPVVKLDSVSKVDIIVDVLKRETHDGFPVVLQHLDSQNVIVFC